MVGTGRDLAVLYADKLTFGATPELVAEIEATTPALWLEQQLEPSSVPEDEWLDATLETFTSLHLEGAEKRTAAKLGGRVELQLAALLRATASRRQLAEMMTSFWHDHFSVTLTFRESIWAGADFHEVVRTHCLGRFSELLEASAKTAAMMYYLDNATSRSPNPNENYAREVLELHTLGVHGGYTEDDVTQAAMALTGWGTSDPRDDSVEYAFEFHPSLHHDEGPVSVVGWSFAAQGGDGAIAQGESLLSYLAHHPSTARHLSTKLVRRFLGDASHPRLVDELADVYLTGGTAIGPWLRALVASEEFQNSVGTKLRRPQEHLVFALRVLGPEIDANGGVNSEARGPLLSLCRSLGHEPFRWPTPDGYPDDDEYWSSTGGVLARWNAMLALALNAVKGVAFDQDGALRYSLRDIEVGELVDALAERLLLRPLAPPDRDTLVAFAGGDTAASAATLTSAQFRTLCALVLCTPTATVR